MADELRELANVKSDFLWTTTHELRRPLGLLRGHLSLITEGTYGEVPETMMPGLRTAEANAVEMRRASASADAARTSGR